MQKTVSEVLKTWVFHILHFSRQAIAGYNPRPQAMLLAWHMFGRGNNVTNLFNIIKCCFKAAGMLNNPHAQKK